MLFFFFFFYICAEKTSCTMAAGGKEQVFRKKMKGNTQTHTRRPINDDGLVVDKSKVQGSFHTLCCPEQGDDSSPFNDR